MVLNASISKLGQYGKSKNQVKELNVECSLTLTFSCRVASQITRKYFSYPTYIKTEIAQQGKTSFLDYTICYDADRGSDGDTIVNGMNTHTMSRAPPKRVCIAASQLIREMYIRFFTLVDGKTNRFLKTPAMVDEYFRPIEHGEFGPCFTIDWRPEMLAGGIYYTRINMYACTRDPRNSSLHSRRAYVLGVII